MAMAAMEAVRRCVARRGGSRRRGGARGLLRCSRGARWLRLRRAVATGAFGRSGEREPGEGGRNERVGERCRASRWLRGVVRGIEGDEKGARQAGREVAWRGGARARRARSPPSVEDEGDRGGGGLGRLLAGPACCWAAQGGAPGKPLLLLFLFSIFF